MEGEQDLRDRDGVSKVNEILDDPSADVLEIREIPKLDRRHIGSEAGHSGLVGRSVPRRHQ